MRENVSVEKALLRGQILLVILPIVLIGGFSALGFFLNEKNIGGKWIVAMGVVGGFISGWLFWSFFVVKWKIWAYENVRNVNELYLKAIEQNIIWPDGSWFNKTEIWSYEQKQKWHRIEHKFGEEDSYKDDISVPKETKLYIAQLEVYWAFGLGIVFLFVFGYLFSVRETLTTKENFVWMISPLVAIYFMYTGFKKLKKLKIPQLIFNENGIYTEETKQEFLWDKILEIHVSVVKSGSYIKFMYLMDFDLPIHEEEEDDAEYELRNFEINISELNRKVPEIEKLLRVYRVRHEKNNPV